MFKRGNILHNYWAYFSRVTLFEETQRELLQVIAQFDAHFFTEVVHIKIGRDQSAWGYEKLQTEQEAHQPYHHPNEGSVRLFFEKFPYNNEQNTRRCCDKTAVHNFPQHTFQYFFRFKSYNIFEIMNHIYLPLKHNTKV